MSATLSRTEDFTEYFSENLRDFIARYPDITERALEEPRRLMSEAQTRMNAANARMIKARVNKHSGQVTQHSGQVTQPSGQVTQPSGQVTKLPEEQEHSRLQIDFFQTKHTLKNFESDIYKYMQFVKSPCNDHIRRFIEEDLPACDTFEKFIYAVNIAHFNDIFNNYPLQCTCNATPDTFQECVYLGTDPQHHVFIPCKGICSRGTKMTIVNREKYFKSCDLIDPYGELTIDVVLA